MTKNKLLLSFLIVFLCLTLLVSSVKADTIITDTTYNPYLNLDFQTGSGLNWMDLANGVTINFTVTDGNLTGHGTFNADNTGGTFSITPNSTGTITVTATTDNYTLTVNGNIILTNIIHFSDTATTVITWVYNIVAPVINPDYPSILNVKPFWQYLFSGNLLGFFGAIFLWSFIEQDILVGAVCMLFLVPIYLKTRSLLLLAILWILLGGFFITAMPAVSGLAVVFLILGVSSVLWKLVHPN